MNRCTNCDKPVDVHVNYCGWDCHVEHAKELGGQVRCPNGLPIRCILADGTMLEHEHGDHPDYKFPVKAEFVGEITDDHRRDYSVSAGQCGTTAEVREFMSETHALLYSDGNVALTIYEHSYVLWDLNAGSLVASGKFWTKGDWRLAPESVEKVCDWAKEEH